LKTPLAGVRVNALVYIGCLVVHPPVASQRIYLPPLFAHCIFNASVALRTPCLEGVTALAHRASMEKLRNERLHIALENLTYITGRNMEIVDVIRIGLSVD